MNKDLNRIKIVLVEKPDKQVACGKVRQLNMYCEQVVLSKVAARFATHESDCNPVQREIERAYCGLTNIFLK